MTAANMKVTGEKAVMREKADMSKRTLKRHPPRYPALTSLPLFLSVLFLPAISAAQNTLPAPIPYEALYEARAMGMRSTAYRRLESSDNQFSLSHGLSVSVLGANLITVEEKSVFTWGERGARPLQYQYKQTGVRRRDERVVFNADAADPSLSIATMTREDREQTLSVDAATLDDLSFSAQLSADLMHKPQLRAADSVLSYQIVDARRLDTHDYRVLGEELISTPAGDLKTLKLERIRDADSERNTTIWLSESHQYILAKLSQTEGGGSAMELTLLEIEWTGDTPAE